MTVRVRARERARESETRGVKSRVSHCDEGSIVLSFVCDNQLLFLRKLEN